MTATTPARLVDLDDAIDYASHRDHSAVQCKNGDRLILALVAELRAVRTSIGLVPWDMRTARTIPAPLVAELVDLLLDLLDDTRVPEAHTHQTYQTYLANRALDVQAALHATVGRRARTWRIDGPHGTQRVTDAVRALQARLDRLDPTTA